MFKPIIGGKVFKVGNDIDTDQIYPGRYLYLTLPNEIAVHAMEDIISDFSKKIAGEDKNIFDSLLPILPGKFLLELDIHDSPEERTPPCAPRQGPQEGVTRPAPAFNKVWIYPNSIHFCNIL